MKLVSWNVNGIRAVYKKNFLSWFKDENADIVCVQETKAWKDQFPKDIIEIPEYKFYCSQAQKKGYSGVAVWSKPDPESVAATIKNELFDNEGRILKFEFKDFVLFNVYFPNGGASKERLKYKIAFYDYFIDYLKKFKNEMVIICGDYNTAHCPLDLARPDQNENTSGFMPEERERLDKLIEIGFADAFRYFNKEPGNYTWWDYKTAARARNVGWRIDYFFVSKKILKYIKSVCIENLVLGSDHCPVSITLF
ncbi:MAG: exodeoxyribonuclease III [Endomicrobium sp.]|jgi:exodeoxyribonuclease-3|nr:exodeoxyribonuclease III [Endomicrobium sp.]